MHRMDYPPPGHRAPYDGLPPLGPLPPGYFHCEPPPPPPHLSSLHPHYPQHGPAYWSHSPYWPPSEFEYPYQPFHNPPSTPNSSFDVSPECRSPLDQTFDHQWEPGTDTSLRASPAPKSQRKEKTSVNVSMDDGYETSGTEKAGKKPRIHCTVKQPLPLDPTLAKKIIRRRQVNKEASRKSRKRLVKRADNGDRYKMILTEVAGHLKNMGIELEKLHITKVSELLRQTGMDTVRLKTEMAELSELINREVILNVE